MRKAHYPKAESKKEVDANLLGPCGFYCGFCLAYAKKKCLGCRYQAKKSEESGLTPMFCDTLVCATEKVVTRCADCAEYPCEKYDHDSILSELYIDYIRNEVKTR